MLMLSIFWTIGLSGVGVFSFWVNKSLRASRPYNPMALTTREKFSYMIKDVVEYFRRGFGLSETLPLTHKRYNLALSHLEDNNADFVVINRNYLYCDKYRIALKILNETDYCDSLVQKFPKIQKSELGTVLKDKIDTFHESQLTQPEYSDAYIKTADDYDYSFFDEVELLEKLDEIMEEESDSQELEQNSLDSSQEKDLSLLSEYDKLYYHTEKIYKSFDGFEPIIVPVDENWRDFKKHEDTLKSISQQKEDYLKELSNRELADAELIDMFDKRLSEVKMDRLRSLYDFFAFAQNTPHENSVVHKDNEITLKAMNKLMRT